MTNPDCPHDDLVLQPDDSGAKMNVYECRMCGVLGFRLWTRSRGLTPFKPYTTNIPAQRRESRTTAAWDAANKMRLRDQRDAEENR